MTALARARQTGLWKPLRTLDALLAADAVIYKGALCGFKGGYLVPWSDSDPDIAHPCIAIPELVDVVDNTGGSAGDLACQIDFGHDKICYLFANDSAPNALAQANIGGDAWGKDDQTVSASSSSGIRSRIGTPWVVSTTNARGFRTGVYVELEGPGGEAALLAMLASTASGDGASLVAIRDAGGYTSAANVEAALQELYPLVLAGMTASKKTVTVGHADLTEAVNNTSQAINISTALPNNARIVGVDMRSLTPFTGGSVSAVTCDIGTSGDVDALIDGADLQTAAVDGGPATMPKGIRPNKMFASGGQLIATFYPDAGHALDALTAGSVVIDVLYIVLA